MRSDIYNRNAWIDKFIYNEPYSSEDEERVKKILDIIPQDVNSILDVGIGGGYIYRGLKKKGFKCCGIDISLELVKRAKENSVLVADINNMPFKEKVFDLVISADVIEHIDRESFNESMSQLKRASRSYILIVCPYKDEVDWPVGYCNSCKKEFNVYGHIRKIDMNLIKRFFPEKEFEYIKIEPFGLKRNLRPLLRVRIARKWGKVYSREGAICPFCKNTHIEHPPRNFIRNFIGKVVCGIFILMDHVIPFCFLSGSEILFLAKKKY